MRRGPPRPPPRPPIFVRDRTPFTSSFEIKQVATKVLGATLKRDMSLPEPSSCTPTFHVKSLAPQETEPKTPGCFTGFSGFCSGLVTTPSKLCCSSQLLTSRMLRNLPRTSSALGNRGPGTLKQCAGTFYQINCLLVGESGVGKTNLVWKFLEKQFFEDHHATPGIGFATKSLGLTDPVAGSIKIHLWDTSGDERYQELLSPYYTNAAAILVIFDLHDQTTFESLPSWISKAKKLSSKDTVIFVVGNKADGTSSRQVTFLDAEKCARAHKLQYLETSAKSGKGVDGLFAQSTQVIWDRISEYGIDHGAVTGIKKLSKPPPSWPGPTEFRQNFTSCDV